MPLLPSRWSVPQGLSNGASALGNQPQRRILFIDAYDSFTNNIVSLLKDALGAHVHIHVLHMDLKTLHADPTPDWTSAQFLDRLASFDAVVCGPGPGSPLCEEDVGAFQLLWRLQQEKIIPVMGICLGFQSLVAHFGGSIRKLRRGMHGMVRDIDHKGKHQYHNAAATADIFENVPSFKATLYHSLCADIGQDTISDQDWGTERWKSPLCAPDLVPLAWITEPELDNERILMAVRHAHLPYWGVQYHPESVCTESGAQEVVKNWFDHAVKWNEATGRQPQPWLFPSVHSDSLDSPQVGNTPRESERDTVTATWREKLDVGLAKIGKSPAYAHKKITLPHGVDASEVAELLCKGDLETILLDSSSSFKGDPLARNSIIALNVDSAIRFEYHVGDSFATLRQPAAATSDTVEVVDKIDLCDGTQDPMAAWQAMSTYWQQRHIPQGTPSDPSFKGGFMGFVTYEMGLSTVSPGAVSTDRGHNRPDICMAWISRSVVLDHKAGVAYIQGLVTPDDDTEDWIDATIAQLENSAAWKTPGQSTAAKNVATQFTNEELLQNVKKGETTDQRLRFRVPDSEKYEKDVRQCQEAISEGHSYELCLTAQTFMTKPRIIFDEMINHLPAMQRAEDRFSCSQKQQERRKEQQQQQQQPLPWDVYRTLRARQPAPFGSFVRLGGATILSCSPERFLSNSPQGLCAMRPMKGTVRKSAAVSTLAEAEKILHIPKEEAENLMIVDLVRHDLHGVCGPGRVTVPELLKVEEYATVFQMVTAVNGQLPGGPTVGAQTQLTGLDVLAAALPPGSMTGAPKKRSCELLQVIEPTERSIYSGVIGFFDINGQGDWSVVIRTIFHWDDETISESESDDVRDVWRIGAGGAVTILSTPEGERDEMFTKLCGPLGVFRDAA